MINLATPRSPFFLLLLVLLPSLLPAQQRDTVDWSKIDLTSAAFKGKIAKPIPDWVYYVVGGGALITIVAILLSDDGGGEPLPQLIARDDQLSLMCATSGTVNVLANDTGEGLSVTAFTQPAGAAVSNAGGGLLQISNVGLSSFSFSYTVVDRAGQTASAGVFVNVTVPEIDAVDDSFAGDSQSPLSGNVLANDVGAVTVVDFTLPSGGALVLEPGGNFTFTPEAGFCNTAHFSYTIEDACGQRDQAAVAISIADATAPILTCPPNITIPCDSNTSPDHTGQASATDDCTDNPTLSYSDEVTGTLCEQIITRTWTAADAAGNEASCVQTITATDDLAPILTCPPDITVNCGQQDVLDITGFATGTDNCFPDIAISYTDDLSGFMDCEGDIIRTWQATDPCGNFSICLQLIHVVPVGCDFVPVFQPFPANCGLSDGAIAVSLSPPGDYLFNWNTGGSGPGLSGIPGGLYVVSITDPSANCTQVFQLVVEEIPPVYVQDINTTPESCMQTGNIILDLGSLSAGNFTVTVTGPVEFTLNGLPPGPVSLADFTFLPAGDYTIQVVDEAINLTCVDLSIVTLPYVPAYQLAVLLIIPPSSPSAADGQVSFTVTGAGLTFPLDVLVNGNFLGQVNNANFTVTNLPAGSYTFLIIDNGGAGCESNAVTVDLMAVPGFSLQALTHGSLMPDWQAWRRQSFDPTPLFDWMDKQGIEHPLFPREPDFNYGVSLPITAAFACPLGSAMELHWMAGLYQGYATARLGELPGGEALQIGSTFRGWSNLLGLRKYTSRKPWAPFFSLNGSWNRLAITENRFWAGRHTGRSLEPWHQDRWEASMSAGFRLNLSDGLFMELESRLLSLPWQAPSLNLSPQMGARARWRF